MGNFRRFKSDVGWLAIRSLVRVVRHLDIASVVLLGRSLGWLASYLLTLRKSVGLLNLDVALGERVSRRQKRRIFRRAVANAAAMVLETAARYFAPREALIKSVRICGLEHLSAAVSAGRGVVLAGGHLGAFTLVAIRLTCEGFRTWVILRLTHDPRVSHLYREALGRIGANWISDRPNPRCVRECFARLRSNEILHVLIDQKPGTGRGCVVPFFGIPTEMFAGAVSLALKTGAAVLPVTMHRRGLTRHVIEIGAPVEIVRTGGRQKDVAVNLARVVKTLEDAIMAYPEEWWMISRRWTRRQVAELTRKPLA